MLDEIKEYFRDKFYDNVEIGGSFTFYKDGRTDDIFHVLDLTNTAVTYQKTWYGYRMGDETTVCREEFKVLVHGGRYHTSDYLYGLRREY